MRPSIIGLGPNSSGFGFFATVTVVIMIIVAISFGCILVGRLREWRKNNQSPRLTVPAKVISKRTNVSSHRHHHGDMHMSHTTHSTTDYATFEVQSGDRMELQMTGTEYGMLMEGDRGNLSFQGTRYLGFQRSEGY